ncbi:hypothetical protein KW782_00375 [Candidatus Parcubacteria bacterium]|nr:hypothetical protein [Candidatus Parcubacteria bacterium]
MNMLNNPMNKNWWKYIRISVWSMVALVGILVFPEATSKLVADEIRTPRKNHFANVQIEAKAAYVYDISTRKTLFAKSEQAVLPLASLTKMMTAVTALEQAPTSTLVTIDRKHLSEEGDSGLLVDEQWSLENLLKFTLVVSSNDGAAAVADAIGRGQTQSGSEITEREAFVKKMNDTSRRLGLTNMWFANESGLDQSESVAGGYGSAQDVARLIEYAVKYHPSIFKSTREAGVTVYSESDVAHTGKNTNIISQKIPGLIAGKTGYSTLAGGNLAVLFEAMPGRPVVIVVLGSSYDARFNDIETLVTIAITALKEQ